MATNEPNFAVAHCGNCCWWKAGRSDPYPALSIDDGTQGLCQRHAPLVTGGMMSDIQTVWPSTKIDDRCGDWDKDGR